MINTKNNNPLALWTNVICILGISVVLLMTFYFQLSLHELPCPYCLLQRVGMFFMAFGFLMNLRFGFRPSH